jgi:hypothetical protein
MSKNQEAKVGNEYEDNESANFVNFMIKLKLLLMINWAKCQIGSSY